MAASIAVCHSNPEYNEQLMEQVGDDVEIESVSDLAPAAKLRRLVTGGFDVIHVDEPVQNGPLCALASRLSGTPLVVYLRGWADVTNAHGQHSRPKATAWRLAATATLRQASAVMAISQRTVEEIARVAPVGDPVVIPRPLDVQEFGRPVATDGGGAERVVATVTNLRYREKFEGVTTILDGIGAVFESGLADCYAIAGSGQFLADLRDRVDGHDWADHIDVLGHVDDVPAFLATADVFAYTSFLDALPTAVLEAQAAGLPVVAGDASGVPEAVGEAGMVVPPTARGMRDGLVSVLSNHQTAAQLSEASRRKASRHNATSVEAHLATWEAAASEVRP